MSYHRCMHSYFGIGSIEVILNPFTPRLDYRGGKPDPRKRRKSSLFHPRSDQFVIFPYIFNALSTRQVTRIKKISHQLGDSVLCDTKLCEIAVKRNVWQSVRRINIQIMGVKGLNDRRLLSGDCWLIVTRGKIRFSLNKY